MFGLEFIEVAIGLSLVYVILATICSAIRERAEAVMRTRSIDLERGIREFLGDPNGTVTQTLYDHPLINGLFRGSYNPANIVAKSRFMPRMNTLPSYIPSAHFATALIEAVVGHGEAGSAAAAPITAERLRAAAQAFPNDQVKGMVLTAIDAAKGDIDQTRKVLEDCFNAAMDRVSGWYKQRSQMFILLLSACVVVAVNANTLTIVERLSLDGSLRKALVDRAAQMPPPRTGNSAVVVPNADAASAVDQREATEAKPGEAGGKTSTTPAARKNPNAGAGDSVAPYSDTDALNDLGGFGVPLGWKDGWPGPRANPREKTQPHEAAKWDWWWYWILQPVFGLLLTVFAVSLGAPVWFDVMNRLVSLRAALKPPVPGAAAGDAPAASVPMALAALPTDVTAFVPRQWKTGDPHAGVL